MNSISPIQQAALEYVEHHQQVGGPNLRGLRQLFELGLVTKEYDKRTWWYITEEGKAALSDLKPVAS